jgi:hypothetical protein
LVFQEKRLQELLKECQEIAMALTRIPGEEAENNDPPPPITLSHPIPSKRKAKKSFPFSASKFVPPTKMRKNYEYDANYSPRMRGEAAPGKEEVC